MKTIQKMAVVMAMAVSVACVAQEKKIERSALPAAVEKALQGQLAGATIKGFATEVEDGKRMYEAELIVNGQTKDIAFLADGTIAEIEEEVAMDSLPAEVKAALMAKAKGGTIHKVESLTKKDKLVAYEAAGKSAAGKKFEVQCGPKGETLKHEE